MLQPLADTRDAVPLGPVMAADIGQWREDVRERAGAALDDFVRDRCEEYVRGIPGAGFVTELLGSYVAGGKYVRPTFTYLGWLCGADESDAALRAAASTARPAGGVVRRAAPGRGRAALRRVGRDLAQ